MKADLAIYAHVLGVSGQYESVALMLSHKMDFNCCANRDGFRKSSHILILTNCYGITNLLLRKFTFTENQTFLRNFYTTKI